jgi:hypothetical protein
MLMSNKVLYFPSISVPETAWFTRMLLYWDAVGTIIPYQLIQRPEDLGEHTRSLLQAELVTPVIPGMHLPYIPEFDESFGDYLGSLGPELDLRRNNFKKGKTAQVHMEKVGALNVVMRNFGLCKGGKDPDYSPWYDVEKDTAADFMAYLAASLGKLEKLEYVPITDKERYCEPLLRQVNRPVEHQEELTSLRFEILQDILPAPKHPISAKQIQDFKDNHGPQLADFRRTVERELVQAAAIKDSQLRQRQLDLFREEVDGQIEEIRARLNESGFGELVLGRLCPIMAAVPGVSFVFGLASAVYNAFRKSPKDEPPSPLVYAAYAQVELLGGARVA